VLVRIHAASINPVDFKTREGKYQMIKREDFPITLGRDFSGVVETCGTRVQGLSKGDAVFALLGRHRGAPSPTLKVRDSGRIAELFQFSSGAVEN
jgi:NADPH:quinone reductase-like Zn-dependent oxidoreductase